MKDLTLGDVARLLASTPGLASLRVEDLLANRWTPSVEGETLRSAILSPRPPARPLPLTQETDTAILAALRESPFPLGFRQIGERVGSARGLAVHLNRLIEEQKIARLDGKEILYTLAERKIGARARVRQSIKDTKYQLKRLRKSLSERPPPEILRFGAALEGREAELFKERTLARDPLKIRDFALRWRVSYQHTRMIENAMMLKLRLYLQKPNADAMAGAPPLQNSVLNVLSLRRLRELADVVGLEVEWGLPKADIVGALLCGPVGLVELLAALTSDELRAICREHELGDSGARKALLARIGGILPEPVPAHGGSTTPRTPRTRRVRPRV